MGSHPLVLLLSPQLSNLLLPSHPKQMTLLLPHRKLRLLDEGSPSSHHPGLATILFSPDAPVSEAPAPVRHQHQLLLPTPLPAPRREVYPLENPSKKVSSRDTKLNGIAFSANLPI